MICPLCKKENTVDMRFCMFCGKEIPRCPSCGTVISKRIAVCPNDGTALPEHILALLPAEQELNADMGAGGNAATNTAARTAPTPAASAIERPVEAPAQAAVETKKTEATRSAPLFQGIVYCCRCGKAFEADGSTLCPSCRSSAARQTAPSAASAPQNRAPEMRQTASRPPAPQNRPTARQSAPNGIRRNVCKRCGAPCAVGQQLCNSCQATLQRSASKSAEKRKNRRMKALVILLTVLLAAALITVGVLLLKFTVFDKPEGNRREDALRAEPTQQVHSSGEKQTEPDASAATEIPTAPTEEETTAGTTEETTEPTSAATGYTSDNARLEYFILHCDSEYFDVQYFAGFNEEDACLARNAIFARSGREFTTDWIRDYFLRFSWYEPLISTETFNNEMLNGYQKSNLENILAYEASQGY